MRIYELIQELRRRGVSLALQDDGKLKFWPEAQARDLLDEMRRKKQWLCEFAAGRYSITAKCVYEMVREAGEIYCGVLADRFPAEVIAEARSGHGLIEQCDGNYRLATDRERTPHRKAVA